MNEVGTIEKLTLDGPSYDVPVDIDITFNRSSFTIEGMPTSGRTMFKKQRRVPTMEGVVLNTSTSEMETLNKLAEQNADFPISVKLADGATYTTVGKISFENYTSADGKSTIVIIPNKTKNAWTYFKA